MFEAAYLSARRSGKLAATASRLRERMRRCDLCPHGCGVDRLAGETGTCGAGARVRVASAHAHMGEERPLVGRRGSGTIFFSHCNLLCVYCQNWDISHQGAGDEMDPPQLAALMLRLQNQGCHNINLVTPTHYVAAILEALDLAAASGLHLPLVYNCGGYESVDVLQLLEGIVDIYMPDCKYMDAAVAARLSPGAEDYPDRVRAAIREMHRQVGCLRCDENGIALRGLIVRHLVLPDDLAATARFAAFIAEEIDARTYVNIMAQYRPCYRALDHPPLHRSLQTGQYRRALEQARSAGLCRLD